ncbi:MAG: 16S rRNA (adenine(1518)-N(6)/adenine(1519)-N(6))-dimethyltransferase RsmA [Bacteroidales bacterium]|nr:16S rRNA (adenine(1518)-N(6)/adenine(1519)-N(6))-dimethyltransferase RsmA [Bacteroidales bacterium]
MYNKVRPKKSLGQHFLKDENIARKIVSYISPQATNVLELGPGMGVLTKHLTAQPYSLKIVELDSESVVYLKKNYSQLNDDIIEGDFLAMDLNTIFNKEFSLIGNFPYNISSQILFKSLEFKHLVNEIVGMFQKEVALRICSEKGNKVYGILSILVQAFYDTEYLMTVEPHVFDPPPKVQSAVIRLRRKQNCTLPCDEKLFFFIVKKAFNQRRKTLRNALKEVSFSTDVPRDFFSKRAEQLSVEDFILLTQNVSEIQKPIK